jgi:DNA invertase Pin-like site-specific DNA recombinase
VPLYGYARVSTIDQDLRLQRATLKAAGCDVIRAEKASGNRRDGRTELQVLLDFVRRGDTIIRIDRLARSMKDLQDIVHELRSRGVALRATEQPVDTSPAAGKAFLDMLGVFAEFEANRRRERQLEGNAAGLHRPQAADRPRRRTAVARQGKAWAECHRQTPGHWPGQGLSRARQSHRRPVRLRIIGRSLR